MRPEYAEAYSNMGLALHNQGKPEDAIEAYKKSISLKPESAKSHHNLSFVLLSQGKIKEGP